MSKKAGNDTPVVQTLDTKKEQEFLATDIEAIDGLIGGIPRGRITEFWGQEKVGKTTLVIDIMSKLKDKKILFIDAEFALNKDRVVQIGANPKNIDYVADARLEKVCELLIESVGKYDLIILDSLAYLVPETVMQAEVGERSIGLYSLLIKHWLAKFRPRLAVSKTAFIAINQYRKPIGLYVKPEAPGGTSWHHAVDVRAYLASNSGDKIIEDKEIVGHWLNIKIVKSKVSQPHLTSKYRVSYKASKQEPKENQ